MNTIVSIIITILVLILTLVVMLGGLILMSKGGGIGVSSNYKNNLILIGGWIIFIPSFIYFIISISNMLYCKNPKYNCKWYDTQNLTFWTKQYWQHLF